MPDQLYESTLARIDAAAQAMGRQTASWEGKDGSSFDGLVTTSHASSRHRRRFGAPVAAAAAVAALAVAATAALDRPASHPHRSAAGPTPASYSAPAPGGDPGGDDPAIDRTGTVIESVLNAAGVSAFHYAHMQTAVTVKGPSIEQYSLQGGYYPSGYRLQGPLHNRASTDRALMPDVHHQRGTVFVSVGRVAPASSPCVGPQASFEPTPIAAGPCSVHTIDDAQVGVVHEKPGDPYSSLAIIVVRPNGVFVSVIVTNKINFSARATTPPTTPLWDWTEEQLAKIALSPQITACSTMHCGAKMLPSPGQHS